MDGYEGVREAFVDACCRSGRGRERERQQRLVASTCSTYISTFTSTWEATCINGNTSTNAVFVDVHVLATCINGRHASTCSTYISTFTFTSTWEATCINGNTSTNVVFVDVHVHVHVHVHILDDDGCCAIGNEDCKQAFGTMMSSHRQLEIPSVVTGLLNCHVDNDWENHDCTGMSDTRGWRCLRTCLCSMTDGYSFLTVMLFLSSAVAIFGSTWVSF